MQIFKAATLLVQGRTSVFLSRVLMKTSRGLEKASDFLRDTRHAMENEESDSIPVRESRDSSRSSTVGNQASVRTQSRINQRKAAAQRKVRESEAQSSEVKETEHVVSPNRKYMRPVVEDFGRQKKAYSDSPKTKGEGWKDSDEWERNHPVGAYEAPYRQGLEENVH